MTAGFPSNPITITAVTPNPGPSSVQATLIGNASQSRQGGTSASASSGGGGWQIEDRTHQKAATVWLDYYPIVLTMTLRIDGGAGTDAQIGDVEQAVATLESFELPVPGSAPALPPILTISGPVQHTDRFWVCSRLELTGGEDGALRNEAGLRTMQMATIELTEYSPPGAIVSDLTPAQLAAQSGTVPSGQVAGASGPTTGTLVASGQTYTVVAGDTLQSIAAKVLGNVADWTQLALLNGLANGAILVPGETLQLPAT